MPEEIIFEIIGQTIGFAMEFAALFWNELILWTGEILSFWANADLLPMAADAIELALSATAEMTGEMITAVVEAWEALKNVVLSALVEIMRSPENSFEWVKQITTIVVTLSGVQKSSDAVEDERQSSVVIGSINQHNHQPIIVKRTVKEVVDWDRLPAEARAAFIRKNQAQYTVDVRDTRDKELSAMRMTQ